MSLKWSKGKNFPSFWKRKIKRSKKIRKTERRKNGEWITRRRHVVTIPSLGKREGEKEWGKRKRKRGGRKSYYSSFLMLVSLKQEQVEKSFKENEMSDSSFLLSFSLLSRSLGCKGLNGTRWEDGMRWKREREEIKGNENGRMRKKGRRIICFNLLKQKIKLKLNP